jgi:peptidoglycan/LPS O-acetylase OafA/YrhL
VAGTGARCARLDRELDYSNMLSPGMPDRIQSPLADRSAPIERSASQPELLQQSPAVAPRGRSQGKNKLLGLELVRFICAVAVLFWHYQHFAFISDTAVGFVKGHQPLYPEFRLFYDNGYQGVPVFWCISGFIFFWKYKQAIAERVVGPKKFFILRFSRLYPLHFATLMLVAALQIVYLARTGFFFVFQKNDLLHFVLQLFMASNWTSLTPEGDSFDGPIWSVSVEILVYCGFFLLLRYVGKSAWLNVGIILACLVAKVARVPSPIVDCLAFFYIGGLSAITMRHFEATKYRKFLAIVALCAVILVPVAVLSTHLNEHEHFSFLFRMAYIPVLLYVFAQNVPVSRGIQKFVEAAGNMTYSSYLIHFPIQLAIAIYFSWVGRSVPYEGLAFFCGFFCVTLLAAYFIFRWFEVPAQSWIRSRYS